MAKLDAEFKCVKGDDALLFHRLQAVEELGRLPQYRIELLPQNSGSAMPRSPTMR